VSGLDGAPVTLDNEKELGVVDRVFKEATRLHPPVPFSPRGVLRDCEIDGWPIPGGTMITASSLVLHRHPDWWTDPDRFDPDRFAPDRAEHRRHSHLFVPFGGRRPHLHRQPLRRADGQGRGQRACFARHQSLGRSGGRVRMQVGADPQAARRAGAHRPLRRGPWPSILAASVGWGSGVVVSRALVVGGLGAWSIFPGRFVIGLGSLIAGLAVSGRMAGSRPGDWTRVTSWWRWHGPTPPARDTSGTWPAPTSPPTSSPGTTVRSETGCSWCRDPTCTAPRSRCAPIRRV
jgi:hypothetical protein